MAKRDLNEMTNPLKGKLAFEVGQPKSRGGDEAARPEKPAAKPESHKLARSKKTLFTVEEQRENDAIVRAIGEAIGAENVAWSSICRVLWYLLRESKEAIGSGQIEAPQLERPSNGNLQALNEFERKLATYVSQLLT